jgi:hypothetical protein
MEHLDLADSQNFSPSTRTLTHPTEKRKKVDTRVKVSTLPVQVKIHKILSGQCWKSK